MGSTGANNPFASAFSLEQPLAAGGSNTVQDLLTGDAYNCNDDHAGPRSIGGLPDIVPPIHTEQSLQGVGAAASGTKAPLAGQWQRTEAPDTAQEVASTSGHHSFASWETKRTCVAVDGVPEDTVDAWFAEADRDGDGFISGLEAKDFFLRTGLPKQALSKIWNTVKSLTKGENEGLSRVQFSVALRLVAFAQSEPYPHPDAIAKAASPQKWQEFRGKPLPPPKVAPSSRQGEGSSQVAAATPTAANASIFAVQQVEPLTSPFRGMDLIDSGAAAAPSGAAPPSTPAQDTSVLPAASSNGSPPRPPPNLPPLALDVRLPPLHPKQAAQLHLLAVGHGSLFAGPTRRGGVLQWGDVEGEIGRPDLPPGVVSLQERWLPPDEDADAAPSTEAVVHEAGKVTCLFADELSNVLWVGHHDGKVSGHSLGDAPGTAINSQQLCCWQAHRVGSVSAICRTPWGELWTGSSRGSVRVWDMARLDALDEPGELPARELRRNGNQRPHAGKVSHIICPAGGQLVWTSGERSILLWCAFTGAYIGALISKEVEPMLEGEGAGSASEREDRKLVIDPSKGLKTDSSGRVICRPSRTEREHYVEEQKCWAVAAEKRSAQYFESIAFRGGKALDGAGKAVQFLGKLGKRIARNAVSEAGLTPESSTTSATVRGNRAADLGEEDEAVLPQPPDRPERAPADTSVGLRPLVSGPDGRVHAGFLSGYLKGFSALGRLLYKKDMGVCVSCLAVVGPRLWVGLADGRIRVLGEPGDGPPGSALSVEEEWAAHEAGVTAIVPARSRVVSMAADGSIRAWCSTLPCPEEQAARRAYADEAGRLVERHELEIFCLTWNVNEARPEAGNALHRWVVDLSREAGLLVVALQEIESGGSSLALAAAKDALLTRQQERGNANAQSWSGFMEMAIGGEWTRLGLRQLSGMLILVYVRSQFLEHIGEVSTASVACGVLGMGGNKGAVAVSFSLHRRRIAFVCSHFAAHQNMVEARNANYMTIVRHLSFAKRGAANVDDVEAQGSGKSEKQHSAAETYDNGSDSDTEAPEPRLLRGQGLKEVDMLVWMGDFNYRIDASYEHAKELAHRNQLTDLLAKDQLRAEMAAGRTFIAMQEAPITFRPTYKFNKVEPYDYDSSEKRRVPAWTDRILFRGTQLRSSAHTDGSLHGGASFRGVSSAPLTPELPGPLLTLDSDEERPFAEATAVVKDGGGAAGRLREHAVSGAEVRVTAKMYSACMDVVDSDHKPVCALLNAVLPVLAPAKARRLAARLMRQVFAGSAPAVPTVIVSPATVKLHQTERPTARLQLVSTSPAWTAFHIGQASPDTAAEGAIPKWLDIFPASGYLPPQGQVSVEVSAAISENLFRTTAFDAELMVYVESGTGAGLGRYNRHSRTDCSFRVKCLTAGSNSSLSD